MTRSTVNMDRQSVTVLASSACKTVYEFIAASRLTSCVLYYNKHSLDVQMEFVYCLEKHLQARTSLAQAKRVCFRQLHFDRHTQLKIKCALCFVQLSDTKAIRRCFTGMLGGRLQAEAERVTTSVTPDRMQGVPWLLVNDLSFASVNLFGNKAALIDLWVSVVSNSRAKVQ